MTNLLGHIETNLGKISSLSHTIPKIIQICNDVSSSGRDLVKVIQMDPVVTAKVLKMVNSSYFGLPNEISSLNPAIIMLGMNTIKNIALSSAIRDSFQFTSKSPISGEDFWRYSMGVAIACNLLGKETRLQKNQMEELFVVGLLHCIGKAFLIQFYPIEYNCVIQKIEMMGEDPVFVETEMFEASHNQVGSRLAELWKLPKPVHDGILQYNCATVNSEKTIQYLYLASSLVKEFQIGFSGDYHTHAKSSDFQEMIGISHEQASSIVLANINEELEKSNAFLKG